METIAIKWLHEPLHTAFKCVLLPHFCHPQWAPGAILLLRKRDLLCVFAARIRCSFSRCRLQMNVAHAGKNLALQRKRERMDTIMAAQEHVALARSLLDLFNSRQSDPAWLDKSMTAFAADSELIDVPSASKYNQKISEVRIPYQTLLRLRSTHPIESTRVC
jgi:hypothetical protein